MNPVSYCVVEDLDHFGSKCYRRIENSVANQMKINQQKALTKETNSNPVIRNLSVISTEALVRNLDFFP